MPGLGNVTQASVQIEAVAAGQLLRRFDAEQAQIGSQRRPDVGQIGQYRKPHTADFIRMQRRAASLSIRTVRVLGVRASLL